MKVPPESSGGRTLSDEEKSTDKHSQPFPSSYSGPTVDCQPGLISWSCKAMWGSLLVIITSLSPENWEVQLSRDDWVNRIRSGAPSSYSAVSSLVVLQSKPCLELRLRLVMCNCSQEEYQVTFLVPDGDSNLCCLHTRADQSQDVSGSGDRLLPNERGGGRNLICILSTVLIFMVCRSWWAGGDWYEPQSGPCAGGLKALCHPDQSLGLFVTVRRIYGNSSSYRPLPSLPTNHKNYDLQSTFLLFS